MKNNQYVMLRASLLELSRQLDKAGVDESIRPVCVLNQANNGRQNLNICFADDNQGGKTYGWNAGSRAVLVIGATFDNGAYVSGTGKFIANTGELVSANEEGIHSPRLQLAPTVVIKLAGAIASRLIASAASAKAETSKAETTPKATKAKAKAKANNAKAKANNAKAEPQQKTG